MSEMDQTADEARATIQKLDAALREGQATLAANQAKLAEAGFTPEVTQKMAAQRTPEQAAEIAEKVRAVKDEIERDLPRSSTRRVRVKPSRQMV